MRITTYTDPETWADYEVHTDEWHDTLRLRLKRWWRRFLTH